MGYYTRFRLEIVGTKGKHEHWSMSNVIEKLLRDSKNAQYSINEIGECIEECTWYEHEKEFKIFSKKFPDVVFKLYGIGEDTEDLWIKYFRKGKMQICKAEIKYPDFDISKLT